MYTIYPERAEILPFPGETARLDCREVQMDAGSAGPFKSAARNPFANDPRVQANDPISLSNRMASPCGSGKRWQQEIAHISISGQQSRFVLHKPWHVPRGSQGAPGFAAPGPWGKVAELSRPDSLGPEDPSSVEHKR
jgi:hypothetical protein